MLGFSGVWVYSGVLRVTIGTEGAEDTVAPENSASLGPGRPQRGRIWVPVPAVTNTAVAG
jgi:hypothetical protein